MLASKHNNGLCNLFRLLRQHRMTRAIDVDQLNAITHLGLDRVTVFRRRHRVLLPLYHQVWVA